MTKSRRAHGTGRPRRLNDWSARVWAAVVTLFGRYDGAPIGWSTSETLCRQGLGPKLKAGIQLAHDIEAVAFENISGLSEILSDQDVFHVHCTLVVRTLQDLRACMLSSLRGYTMQAWTAAASAFEAAHAMSWIGTSSEQADKWLTHSDQTKLPFSVRGAVQSTYDSLEMGDVSSRPGLVTGEYHHYQIVCMAKHVNPLAERRRYWIGEGDSTRLMFTPFISKGRIKEAKLAIALACRSALLATWVFCKIHLREVDARLPQLGKRSAELLECWREC